MSKRTVLILTYSKLDSDPRVLRQIESLNKDFHIETSAVVAGPDASIPFYPIYEVPSFSLKRKLKRLFQFITRNYDEYYWNAGRQELMNILAAKNYNVIVANDIHTLPLALAIAGDTGKIYFDAHEYHPREWEDNLKWNLVYKKYIGYLCKKYIPKAAAFTTVSEGIALEYEKFVGIKPFVLTNAVNFYELKPTIVNQDKIKIVHHGLATPSRKLENMVEMMNHLDSHYSLDLILMPGDKSYIEELKSMAKGKSNINFPEPVKTKDIPDFLNKYDIGLIMVPPTNLNYKYGLGNKFFEFIQARLALAIGPLPEMARYVRQHNLGIVTDDFTAESMASAIRSLDSEQIMIFKKNSESMAKTLSAEENLKKINNIVSALIPDKR